MIELQEVIEHMRNHSYMSGIERDELRIKATAEVFTPNELVISMLDKLEPKDFDEGENFLDPSCGDGQFLSEIIIRKMELGQNFESALSDVYGVELMQDNVDICRKRLLCGQDHLSEIVNRQIVCADALTYNYSFGEPIGLEQFFK